MRGRAHILQAFAQLVSAALLVLSAAPAAVAEDMPPPGEVRYIERDAASSNCIGDPKTPLCAVETWLACKIRRNPGLCGLVDRRSPRGAELLFIDRLQYGVVWAGTVKDCGEMNWPDTSVRCPEDALAATVRVEEMDGRGYILGRNTYRLLRNGIGWRIMEIVSNGNTMRLFQEPQKGLY